MHAAIYAFEHDTTRRRFVSPFQNGSPHSETSALHFC